MKLSVHSYQLQFKQPAGTSRAVYTSRDVWFILAEQDGIFGIGECAPLPGLSKESPEEVKELLERISSNAIGYPDLFDLTACTSSVRMGLESAILDLQHGGKRVLFPSAFTDGEAGIPINGLIWMGDKDFMSKQIADKIRKGFRCLKLKIGAIKFEDELELLGSIRKQFSEKELTLRVDANGAFDAKTVLQKLDRLSCFGLHSIEQPIGSGQWDRMADLCRQSPIPIALDEELIGIHDAARKEELLDAVKPHYLVLKPSLHGSFSSCDEWISLADNRGISWWVTSYLESNIGLNAIAQWAFTKRVKLYQGLGTGQLFTNNITSPLEIRGEELWMNTSVKFEMPAL